jgi:hypothetical protein
LLSSAHIVLVQIFQRLDDLVIGDRFSRAGVKSESGYGFDREHIGGPRSENGPLLLLANVPGGKHVPRMIEMPGRMKQMGGTDGRGGLLRKGVADVLSHSWLH